MAKKNNKEKAKELAQTFGKKVKRSDVKAAEEAGYSADVIRAAADRVGKVGDKATAYMDSSGSNSSDSKGPKKIQYANLPGTPGQRVVLDKDGRYLATGKDLNYIDDTKNGRGALWGGKYRTPQGGAVERLNAYLKESGNRLTPGKNPEKWGIIDTRQITVGAQRAETGLPQGKEYVNIYAKIGGKSGGKNGGKGEGGGEGSGRSSGSGGSGGSGGTTNEIVERGRTGMNTITGYNRTGIKPELLTNGYTEGNAVDDVADYSNRLDLYNQRQIGAMYDIAEASRYRTGSILNRWVTGLPAAPQLDSTDELIKTLNRSINEIKI